MKCVGIDGAGYLVEVAETYPDCSEYVLVTVAYADRLTYWADLAIELDPSGSVFYPLVGSMLLAAGSVLGLRVVVRSLRTLQREA